MYDSYYMTNTQEQYCSKRVNKNGHTYELCRATSECFDKHDAVNGHCPNGLAHMCTLTHLSSLQIVHAKSFCAAECRSHSGCASDQYCSNRTTLLGVQYHVCENRQNCQYYDNAIDGQCPSGTYRPTRHSQPQQTDINRLCCMYICVVLACSDHNDCKGKQYCAKRTNSRGLTFAVCNSLRYCFLNSDSVDGYCPSGLHS